MRAAIYCRVSTVEQASNLSLPTQEKACREYCARHDYVVDQVFVDAGESAKTTDRPEFLRLLQHCRKHTGHLHAVVVYSLTRFSRNSTDHHAIVSLLRGLGITLRSVTEPIDESPSGRLMEGILAAMAQFDNDVRSERVLAGMKAAVERGRWVWPPPVGYLKGDARAGASLVPDPASSTIVREAFERYAGGMIGRELLEHLTAMGLRTRRGHRMHLKRLYELLRHPVYAGRIRSLALGLEIPADFAPLVSEELWTRVQLQLNHPSRAAKAAMVHLNHRDFPLRRFVRCGQCGGGFTGSWSKGRGGRRYGFYHCIHGHARVPRARLEAAFLELLDTLRPRPEYWAVLRAAVLDTWRETRKGAGATLARARHTVSELEAKLARVEEAFLYRGSIDEPTYRAHRDKLREDIALAKMKEGEATLEELDVEGLLAFAEHALAHAGTIWSAAVSIHQKVRAEWAYFPGGLEWGIETFKRPVSCLEFYQLPDRISARGELVDLTGIEPVTS